MQLTLLIATNFYHYDSHAQPPGIKRPCEKKIPSLSSCFSHVKSFLLAGLLHGVMGGLGGRLVCILVVGDFDAQ